MSLKKIKKIEFVLLVIVMFQVLLLVNMSLANSYIIHQANSFENSRAIKEKNKINSLINKGINLLIGFLSIKQIGSVSALSWYCCPKTKEGAICQDILFTDSESCAVSLLQTGCDQVAECKKGCCFDSDEGLCTPASTQQECTNNGGEWDDEESCLIQKCQRGCCVLGSQTDFVTEKRCEKLSLLSGFEKEFRQQIKTELECLGLAESLIKGACVLGGGGCRFVTETECKRIHGEEFYPDYLCSADELGTNCEKQISIGCVEERDEIYWFDSCGNRENIYSSDKDASWNNGKVLKKSESCGAGFSNAGSRTCGNCDSLLGSKCSNTKTGETHMKEGDYICKNMNCGERKNGESWCEYDGVIGGGKDSVGSEHWRASCFEGKVEIDRCGEYRGGLCTESIMDGFSIASCVVNEASACVTYNPMQEEDEDDEDEMIDIEENIKKCEGNKHCLIKTVDLTREGDDGEDDSFVFKMCVPEYPKGTDLTNGIDDNLCAIATQECKIIYQKQLSGWECIANCDCEEDEFAEKMNDFCVSLGDCGSYINYVGGGSDNVKIKGKKGFKLNSDGEEDTDKKSREKGDAPDFFEWTNYAGNENPDSNQNVEPQSMKEFLASIGEFEIGEGDISDETADKLNLYLGTIPGAAISIPTLLFPSISKISVLGIKIGAVSTAFSGIGLGMLVGWSLSKLFGIGGAAATVMVISGGVGGLITGLMIIEDIAIVSWSGLGLLLTIIIMAIITIFGLGKAETRIVKFECLPWQAPLGGDDCEKCNDALKPCTKYRCESLGQACKLLNENTENPVCKSVPKENNPPIISLKEIITEGYEFVNGEIKKENGECIQEFSSVSFKLKTNEYARCKWSLDRPNSPIYEDMTGEYPFEQNSFTIDHTFEINMPSIHSLDPSEISGDLKEWYGNMKMYVKCQDAWGNFNIDEYIVNFCINSGPDLTAVDHTWTATKPKDSIFLKYNSTKSDFTIWINEPAECRYDIVENKNYNEMIPMEECKTELANKELYGWPCSTILTDLSNGENKFYIKCKDKPWVQTEEDIAEYEERNINQDDFVYTLYVSESELKIDSILPQGEIKAGFEPISVDLKVETSGGMDNGKSACYFSFLSYENMNLFFDSFSDSHKQNFNLMKGDYNIYVKCQDDSGNIDYGNAGFSLNIDSSPPDAVRVYGEGNNLILLTDEEAECVYDFNRCNFNIDDAISMTTAFSTRHSANLIIGKTYYIKCEDVWGNKNNECAIIVRSGSL